MKQNQVKQKFNEIEFGELYFSETEFNETEFGETDFGVGIEIHFWNNETEIRTGEIDFCKS